MVKEVMSSRAKSYLLSSWGPQWCFTSYCPIDAIPKFLSIITWSWIASWISTVLWELRSMPDLPLSISWSSQIKLSVWNEFIYIQEPGSYNMDVSSKRCTKGLNRLPKLDMFDCSKFRTHNTLDIYECSEATKKHRSNGTSWSYSNFSQKLRIWR